MERRFLSSFMMMESDEPGLVQDELGGVYVVTPEGLRVQLGAADEQAVSGGILEPTDDHATGGEAMGDGFSAGDHVRADFGDGPVIAHYDHGPVENAAGETKHVIQAPDGETYELAYREPSDRDDQGSGLTFWKL